MSGSNITHRRFTYINDPKWPSAAIDAHHVIVRESNLKGLFVSLLAFSFAAIGFYIFLVLVESVVIMPGFGVQLETHYRSGRILRRFVPVSKILKPVLLERVTPVTCYWILCLILREEEELTLIFKA
ncbi:hypothetical protein LINPERHAP1_LOCUS32212 [Linum perenne]